MAGALLAEVTWSTTAPTPGGITPATAAVGYRARPARLRHEPERPAPTPARVSRITVGVTGTAPGTAPRSGTTSPAPAPGVAFDDIVGQFGCVCATPVHQLVTPAAPSQDIEMWTWLRWQVVSRPGPALAGSRHPRYSVQLRPGSYIRIIRLSQMMYMMPMRRAMACGVPSGAGASSQATNASAISFSAGTRAERIQSTARPSKCSLVLEVQVRGM